MSSMPLCAAHHPMPDFNGDAIAQYMRTDFITLPDHLSVNGAREYFVSQLTTDDIPGQVFVVAGKALRGVLSIKRLLQEKDTSLNINHLTDSCLFHVKPDDERAQVVAKLTERELDLVAVVEKGELVGCLMEKEIAHLQEDDVTEDVQLQGATLPLEKPYLEISPWTLWKKRSVWLLLLFVAEAYTSSVLQHFEEALESAIALAFFIPLLIGTGGNSGTQITSTLVRSMALGEVRLRDMGRVIRKEVSTSLLIALTLGLAGCLRAWMMGIGVEITLIVSLTLVCITLWSAVVSSVIPMVLKRIGIDPAVVSAPFIATLIDGTGLIIYFKIAQYFLGLN
ncbi:magnesium transporter [Citrobacter sp. RHBSTW-00678]|uniref:SLC41A/MgtE integral membrane domain-containing protein n=1 Tax=Citrobacter braakii TaxID=57706 RepID=A0AAD1P159_CITBR|nr:MULTISPECIES: magnesium transporter [Citrobacter]AUV24246.1 magnesium transporter [Citrobacter freundii complex sp. CFNIH3]EGT0675448.1 magnesium transporter [Citrobacter braakii]ELK7437047.1 magnesium transporter [Citrobacter braakii]MBA7756005.1 magnesium transporter [Citrobacter sp. RHBSTW-00325]MBA8056218.1 magnesium transporter [Citrobacter sp. RHBSTW-00104]